MDDLETWLDGLRERLAGATAYQDNIRWMGLPANAPMLVVLRAEQSDADLIAHAPEDLARAVAEIEQLRAEVDHWQQLASMACECPPAGCDCPGCSLARETEGRGEEE